MSQRQLFSGILKFGTSGSYETACQEVIKQIPEIERKEIDQLLHSKLILLADFDRISDQAHWERTCKAFTILAKHAPLGYITAACYNDPMQFKVIHANNRLKMPFPAESAARQPAEDYFPFRRDSQRHLIGRNFQGEDFEDIWTIKKVDYDDLNIFCITDKDDIAYNGFIEGVYFAKIEGLVASIYAPSESSIKNINFRKDPAAQQVVYNNDAQPGDVLASIWADGQHFKVYTCLGYEDVTTPLGNFEQCMKIKLDIYWVSTEVEDYAPEVMFDVNGHRQKAFLTGSRHQYFAKGTGLVKAEYLRENGPYLELDAYH